MWFFEENLGREKRRERERGEEEREEVIIFCGCVFRIQE